MEGTFKAKVIEAYEGRSKNGYMQATLRFEITKGPLMGRELQHWLYLNTTKNAERALETMIRCGYDGQSLGSMLHGPEVEIVVEEEKRLDGKGTRPRVRWVNQVRPRPVLPASEIVGLHEKLRKLAEKKGLQLSLPKPSSFDDDAPEPEHDGRIDDEETPF